MARALPAEMLGADMRPNKLIDTAISTPLFHLPLGAIAGSAPGDIVAVRLRPRNKSEILCHNHVVHDR